MAPPGGSSRRAMATASVARRSSISSPSRRSRAARYSGDSPGKVMPTVSPLVELAPGAAIRLPVLEHGQHVARRVLEPGDVRPVAARDALVVLLEGVVPLEAHAARCQPADGLVDVVD